MLNFPVHIARLITVFTRQEITALFKAARPLLKNTFFDVRVAPKSLPYCRILIVLSRKVGNAPTRNQIRRRLKAIFYENQLFAGQRDIIFIGRPGLGVKSFDELKEILTKIDQSGSSNS